MFFLVLLLRHLTRSVRHAHSANGMRIQKEPWHYTVVSTFYPYLSQHDADPRVYKNPTNGWYYATKSTQVNVVIWRSPYLTTLNVGESKVVWTPNNTTACRDIWVPELHLVRQKCYSYFAATTCDGDNTNHRMFVLENENEDPFQGEF